MDDLISFIKNASDKECNDLQFHITERKRALFGEYAEEIKITKALKLLKDNVTPDVAICLIGEKRYTELLNNGLIFLKEGRVIIT